MSKEGLDDINIYTSAVADGKHLDVNIDLLPQGLVDEIGTYKNWDEAYDALKGKYRREMIEYKSMIIEEAKRQGYESIEISGKRATGSKKGTVQSTGVIDLTN